MSDPILEELWLVREKLLEQHGGLEDYLAYVQKLDHARRQRGQRSRGKKPRNQKEAMSRRTRPSL